MIPLSERIATDGITLTFTTTERYGKRLYSGIFHFEGRTLAHDWSESVDATEEPSTFEILAPAIRFSATAEAADDFEEWAEDFGKEASQENRETYTSWLEIAKNLRAFLGDERYEAYAYDSETHE